MRRVAVSRAVAFRASGSSLKPLHPPPVARSVIRSSSSTQRSRARPCPPAPRSRADGPAWSSGGGEAPRPAPGSFAARAAPAACPAGQPGSPRLLRSWQIRRSGPAIPRNELLRYAESIVRPSSSLARGLPEPERRICQDRRRRGEPGLPCGTSCGSSSCSERPGSRTGSFAAA